MEVLTFVVSLCAQFDSTPDGMSDYAPVPEVYQYWMSGPPYTKVLLELHKCAFTSLSSAQHLSAAVPSSFVWPVVVALLGSETSAGPAFSTLSGTLRSPLYD